VNRQPYAPDIIDIDLWDPAAFADGPPYEAFAALRAQAPVAFHPERPRREGGREGPGFWCVTSHSAIHEVSTNPEIYSSWLGGFTGADLSGAVLEETRLNLMGMDPPDHTALRRSVREPFGPKWVHGLSDAIAGFTREILDTAIAKARHNDGHIDFVAEIAAELPLMVLAHIMGVGPEDRGLFYDWSNRIIGNHDPDFGGSVRDFLAAKDELFEYGREVIAHKRVEPGDDMVSWFVSTDIDGESLDDERIVLLWFLLLVAGNETTRSSLTGAMEVLSQFPEQRQLLCEDLDANMPAFVEEVLRYTNPVLHFRRTATQDIELGGAQICTGDKLLLWYPAANRDPDVFADPDSFNLGREVNNHLAFGVGAHFCLGARLGRLQLQIMLTEILTRIPDIEVVAPAKRAHSNFLNSAKTLPVRLWADSPAS
jgi:cytochrome P450/NADPH-cytochrome P450 reductase